MKNKQLVENILKHVGGTANIATAAHCMTRLRLNLKDTSRWLTKRRSIRSTV